MKVTNWACVYFSLRLNVSMPYRFVQLPGSRIRARYVVLEGRWRDEKAAHSVVFLPQPGRDSIHARFAQRCVPIPRLEPGEHRGDRGDRLRLRESAVPGAIDVHLPQQVLLSRGPHRVAVGRFFLRHHQSVTDRMHRENRDVQVAVEADESIEIRDRLWIRSDARSGIQRAKIRRKVETGGCAKSGALGADR